MKRLLLFILSISIFTLTSCWDSKELTKIYVVSGIAIDSVPNSENITLSVQVLKQTSSKSDGKEKSGNQTLVFQTEATTISEGIKLVNRDIDKELYMPHNQVVLFSEDIARNGIIDYIDFFLRNLKSRIGVALFVVKGKASDLLIKEIDGVGMSGVYLTQMVDSFEKISPYYKVRLFDFIERILDTSTSPVIPYLGIKEKENKNIIEVYGMGVFKKDKMIFNIEPKQVENYVLTMGKVLGGYIETKNNEDGKVIFNISEHNLKKSVKYKDGKVYINLNYVTKLNINEIIGYKNYDPSELMEELEKVAKQTIYDDISSLYEINRYHETDIYEYGLTLYRTDYKSWKKIKNSWEELYLDSILNINIDLKITDVGKIINTLEVNNDSR